MDAVTQRSVNKLNVQTREIVAIAWTIITYTVTVTECSTVNTYLTTVVIDLLKLLSVWKTILVFTKAVKHLQMYYVIFRTNKAICRTETDRGHNRRSQCLPTCPAREKRPPIWQKPHRIVFVLLPISVLDHCATGAPDAAILNFNAFMIVQKVGLLHNVSVIRVQKYILHTTFTFDWKVRYIMHVNQRVYV